MTYQDIRAFKTGVGNEILAKYPKRREKKLLGIILKKNINSFLFFITFSPLIISSIKRYNIITVYKLSSSFASRFLFDTYALFFFFMIMKKKRSFILFMTLALLLYRLSATADDFGQPWNSTVKTGDALLEAHHTQSSPPRPIYNGVQGGAYILIRFFQIAISPQDGPSCRYSPTCSAYGRQAVQKFGAFFGALMVGDRLIRCNPYIPPGNDPLPDKLTQ